MSRDGLQLSADERLRYELLRSILIWGADKDPVLIAERCYRFVKGETLTIEDGRREAANRLPAPPGEMGETDEATDASEPNDALRDAAARHRGSTATARLRKPEREMLAWMAEEQKTRPVTAAHITDHFKTSYQTTLNRLNKLRGMGLVVRYGTKGAGVHYEAVADPPPPPGDGEDDDGESTPSIPLRRKAKRRFTDHIPLNPEAVEGLDADHEAVTEGRTLFPSTVVDPSESPRLLVGGENSRKIGGKVVKGPWAGFPIYTLTLEERATCPSSCFHWTTCYGNAMPRARRHRHGPDFEERLAKELAMLQKQHPGGFVVRAHVLGDFYSVDYVRVWARWLDKYPALHVFGYTAWRRTTRIGYEIDKLANARWSRFAVRFSEAESKPGGVTTIWRKPEAAVVDEGIVCPAQTGASDCCGTCGLCWHENAAHKTIVFVAHGAMGRHRQNLRKTAYDPGEKINTVPEKPAGNGSATPAPRIVNRDRQAELAAIAEFERTEGVTKLEPGESAFPPDQDCFSAKARDLGKKTISRRRKAAAELARVWQR